MLLKNQAASGPLLFPALDLSGCKLGTRGGVPLLTAAKVQGTTGRLILNYPKE